MENQKTLSWREQFTVLNQEVKNARKEVATAKADITVKHRAVNLLLGDKRRADTQEKACIHVNNTVGYSTRVENATFVEHCGLFKNGCTNTDCPMYPKYQVYETKRAACDAAVRARRSFVIGSVFGLFR